MDGVGFLAEAMDLHPEAKRALLTAYADTNAAIDAINEARIHYYLMKPWDPPEEKLFPALDDLLHDWTAQFRPPYEGIRVLGTRWSSRSYDLRDFLARNQVPYQWIDVELASTDPEVRRADRIARAGGGDAAADLVSRRAAHSGAFVSGNCGQDRLANARADDVLRSGDHRRRARRALRRPCTARRKACAR